MAAERLLLEHDNNMSGVLCGDGVSLGLVLEGLDEYDFISRLAMAWDSPAPWPCLYG
jgi:hypothetical protein